MIVPDVMPHSAASHMGLYCLPISYKKDARLKKIFRTLSHLKVVSLTYSAS